MPASEPLVRAGTAEELREAGRRVITVGRMPVLVLWDGAAFRALDNRCPHMGFPLAKGDIANGLLDCHWHHARFDVTCGATLDPWADDVDCYRVVEQDGEVFVDPQREPRDPRTHGLSRLGRGLADDLRLVITKAVVEMAEGGVAPDDAITVGTTYGASQREDGWQPGLSILGCMANVLHQMDRRDRQRALAQALARIAGDCAGRAPRRPLPGLVGCRRDAAGLRAWFRETVEVRDADGAERVLRTIATEHGATAALDAVLAAVTDHRYSDVGHTLDYAAKCAELAEHTEGAVDPGLLFTSLVPQLVGMQRMEETSAWRRPVDLAEVVRVSSAVVPPDPFRTPPKGYVAPVPDEDALVELLLGDDAAAAGTALVGRLRNGAAPAALADAVVSAAVMRVLRFGTANELADWDTVHHTLTYANAVAECMRRAPSPELFRAVLDGAMSVYLDRFLNMPPAPLPSATDGASPDALAKELLAAYDRRGGMDECSVLAWSFLEAGGGTDRLFATLAHVVLREDAGFHELQQLDICRRRVQRRGDCRSSRLALVATARWIASQFPTRRAREQTFDIATRLHRGESLAG